MNYGRCFSSVVSACTVAILCLGCHSVSGNPDGWITQNVPESAPSGWSGIRDDSAGLSAYLPSGWYEFKPNVDADRTALWSRVQTVQPSLADLNESSLSVGSGAELCALDETTDALKPLVFTTFEVSHTTTDDAQTLDGIEQSLKTKDSKVERVDLPIGPALRSEQDSSRPSLKGGDVAVQVVCYTFIRYKDRYDATFTIPTERLAEAMPTIRQIAQTIRVSPPPTLDGWVRNPVIHRVNPPARFLTPYAPAIQPDHSPITTVVASTTWGDLSAEAAQPKIYAEEERTDFGRKSGRDKVSPVSLGASNDPDMGRPGTLPPLAELEDETSIVGDQKGIAFDPQYGGLVLGLDSGLGILATAKSDDGLLVNLRTAELNYIAPPDLIDSQIRCPSALLVRSYRSELAKLGKHSPGLPVGWVHNYDVIIKLPDSRNRWDPVTLTYPNKAQERIQPVLDASGAPTGIGHPLDNAAYDVRMEPGSAINTYKSITITWPKTHVHWFFDMHQSGVMVLRRVGAAIDTEDDIRLSYLGDRSLHSVTWLRQGKELLKLEYRNGLVSSAANDAGLTVSYTYDTLNGNSVLWKVSGPCRRNDSPTDRYVYGYANEIAYPALAQIAAPDNEGWAKSHIVYLDGAITEVDGASGKKQFLSGG